MQLLWAVDHGLRSGSKQMHRSLGLTGPQRLVLRIVGRSPGVTPSDLAALLHLDRGTLSGILERLVAQRLLSRLPHPEDGRSVRLELTQKGKQLNRERAGTIEARVTRALAKLRAPEVKAAQKVLEALARELTNA
ncbi:MAG TPA: MarR family transcriptional regulator [Polyangiaceae bacterium]|nr:MarR family transcriptional regulator [Polyangiaceae bacterium]